MFPKNVFEDFYKISKWGKPADFPTSDLMTLGSRLHTCVGMLYAFVSTSHKKETFDGLPSHLTLLRAVPVLAPKSPRDRMSRFISLCTHAPSTRPTTLKHLLVEEIRDACATADTSCVVHAHDRRRGPVGLLRRIQAVLWRVSQSCVIKHKANLTKVAIHFLIHCHRLIILSLNVIIP